MLCHQKQVFDDRYTPSFTFSSDQLFGRLPFGCESIRTKNDCLLLLWYFLQVCIFVSNKANSNDLSIDLQKEQKLSL